jgi:transcriptional regulator with XRE-family HTH domain
MGTKITFGLAIRRGREAAGLSVAALAGRLGVRPQAVYQLEADERRPSLDSLRHLARELGLDAGELLRLVPEAPP